MNVPSLNRDRDRDRETRPLNVFFAGAVLSLQILLGSIFQRVAATHTDRHRQRHLLIRQRRGQQTKQGRGDQEGLVVLSLSLFLNDLDLPPFLGHRLVPNNTRPAPLHGPCLQVETDDQIGPPSSLSILLHGDQRAKGDKGRKGDLEGKGGKKRAQREPLITGPSFVFQTARPLAPILAKRPPSLLLSPSLGLPSPRSLLSCPLSVCL